MGVTGQPLVKPAVIDMLKPWMEGEHVKSNECRVKMLQSRSLVDLYKCMGTRCYFTTNESVMMVIHLYTHGLQHDSLFCAYCSYCETNNPESLVKHIEDVHTVGKYQCRFCFYRAFDAGNAVHHQYLHHKGFSNMKHTIITLHEDKTPPNIDYTNEAKSSSAKKRSYLECPVCHSTHVSISLFAAHVRTHGDSTTECPVCLTTVDTRLVQAHLINHRMDHFECLYCTAVYGYQQDMQHHLCNVHYLRAMNCKTPYDIYTTEKLSIDVPSERLIDCDTFLNRFLYETEDGSESLNIISPSNEIKQIGLPKIVKVQGGIQMTKNLLRASVLSVPEKVASIDTIGGSGCATVAQTVFKDGQIVKVQEGSHMKDICQNEEVIRCKHCYMTGFSIDSYIIHLNIHRLEKFACFLCTHNHFLLRNVVEHMKDVHKCNALRISFAHPQKVNLLQDVIVLIPAGLSEVNIEKHIDRVILEGTKNNLIKFSLPKQVNPRMLYTCGFCQEILTSKLCLERHILLCTQKNNNYYPCAHCACRFTDWIDNLSTISQHLYFHGERLFKCASCTYHHFQRSNVADHITQFCSKPGSTVSIVRESRLIWKCHICFYRSLFKQAIMEHMQNTHNLPGERYLCALCDSRLSTFSEMKMHCQKQHYGDNVSMVEMYHPLGKINEEIYGMRKNNRAFCLKALVRCFYCNELNTCEALRQHCSDRHSTKQFVCIDFWDSFKCGLCLYRNGSGSEKDFWLHFKNFHVKLWNKYTCYGYIDQLFLDWALNLGRNEQSSGSQPELKAIRFICNYCNESDTSEVSIGSHVARHWLKFNCVWCQKVFKYLKHLYYHAIAIHRMDDLEIGLTFSNEYDKHLLDVLMVFENGLILSKRQVQHTTMATLEHLKSGFQSYYNEQVKSTDSYKETLLMPIFTSRKSEVSTAETCKTFIQNQLLHLEIVLERVSNDHLEGKEN
ncbi:PR domain zinc finger protein 15-like [Anopheles ziemanni]|uniref:PR domain zinc finger protein 15-like n=1 Tax=Anopheles ziemanni TaxID=345580 RepID=UPI00265F9F1E|nr:PR domain zinc finger protein 15-like [Anopheles ziemanni]